MAKSPGKMPVIDTRAAVGNTGRLDSSDSGGTPLSASDKSSRSPSAMQLSAGGSSTRLNLSHGASSVLHEHIHTQTDAEIAAKIEELEKQLEKQLRHRDAAENMLKLKTKKSERAELTALLESYSQNVEKLRAEIANLTRRSKARYDCGHSLSDLIDMVESMNLSRKEVEERMQWVQQQMQREQKLKAGAENLAKQYGASKNIDQKLLQEVFQQLKESNNKLSLLKVALDKYSTRLDATAGNAVLSPGGLLSVEKPPGSEHAKGEEETLYKARKAAVTGKLRIKFMNARNIAPPHRKLDLRCVIKVDSVVRARTTIKTKTNLPEWNEDFELALDGATDIEVQMFAHDDLYAIHYLDVKALQTEPPPDSDRVLEMEPRGELMVHITFIPKSSQNINRRGAVKKRKMQMNMIRFLGFKKADAIATSLQKEVTMRKRETRQQPASPSISPNKMAVSPIAPPSVKPPRLDEFTLIRVLGRGNFGKVMLVEHNQTRKMYAIKVLKKEFIIENDEVESVKAEKRVFQVTNHGNHPYLVKLHSCFQSKDRIFFVMEYVSGGDLMMHIQRQVFSEQRAKLYAAEVLLALEHLHNHDIVYRDLKLDNILMDTDGHIKVADYGLCKENMGWKRTTNTFCGTPEFMAPEILLEKDYTRAVDWWAFGVLLYEMILAQSPFKGAAEEEIFEAILESPVNYPSRLHPTARNLIERLLERDPQKRLGGGPRDAQEVKEHEYFAGIDWDALLRKEVPATYKPIIRDARDTTNFDPEFTREPAQITPMEITLTTADQEEFRGFSYVASWAPNSAFHPGTPV